MQYLKYAIPDVIALLDDLLETRSTAAWMAGYARVTAVVRLSPKATVVIATPLYVEHVSPPPSE